MKDIILKNKLICIALMICQAIFFIVVIKIYQQSGNIISTLLVNNLLWLYPITTAILIYFILKCSHQRDINSKQEEFIKSLMKERHDFLNHLNLLSFLIGENKLEEAEVYLDRLGILTSASSQVEKIKNSYVASVLNKFIHKAEAKQIAFEINISLDDFLNLDISPMHSTIILSNLLQNALENCEQSNGYITLSTDNDEDYFYVNIENTGEPLKLKGKTILDWQEELFSGKSTKGENRGNGLLIIKEILDEYEDCSLQIVNKNTPTFVLKLKKKVDDNND
jgi:sensor histidine kinase regulating citrate/malate metabolism